MLIYISDPFRHCVMKDIRVACLNMSIMLERGAERRVKNISRVTLTNYTHHIRCASLVLGLFFERVSMCCPGFGKCDQRGRERFIIDSATTHPTYSSVGTSNISCDPTTRIVKLNLGPSFLLPKWTYSRVKLSTEGLELSCLQAHDETH